MKTCETCKSYKIPIKEEPCCNCHTIGWENWEPKKKEIEIEDAFKTFNIEEAKQKTKIKDSGSRTEFETGAVRDMHEGKGDMLSIPPNAILRLSILYEQGAKKYDRFNYLKGIPCSSFMDSALRHLAKYNAGYDDEDHLASAVFNILGIMEMEAVMPEMQDIPSRQGKKGFNYLKK